MCVQASVLLSHVLAPPDVLLQLVRVLFGQFLHLPPQVCYLLPQGFAPLDIPLEIGVLLLGQLLHLRGQLLDLLAQLLLLLRVLLGQALSS